jgi:CarD family transcriptional regulator
VENHTINGKVYSQMYRIFFSAINMQYLVSTNKIIDVGVRKMCNPEIAEMVLNMLANSEVKQKSLSNKRIPDYITRLTLNSPLVTAEVLKELHSTMANPNKSYQERETYDNALNRLVSELSVVLNTTEEQMKDRILSTLSNNSSIEQVTKIEQDDFEEESEEVEGESDFEAQEAVM